MTFTEEDLITSLRIQPLIIVLRPTNKDLEQDFFCTDLFFVVNKLRNEGVRHIESQVTNTLGWSATTGQVEPWIYRELTETYMLDPEMRSRLSELNSKASAAVANRLLEAHERQYWQPDEEMLDALRAASEELEDRLEGVEGEIAA